MHHVFIINPKAGKKDKTEEIVRQIRHATRDKKVDLSIHVTEKPKHASKIVLEEIDKHPDEQIRFYACGGDGTLNEVAASAAGRDHVSVTHFPSGTGNDFVKTFGGAKAFERIEDLIDAKDRKIDIIESDCGVSANILSVGFDAKIAAGMQKYKKIPLLSGQWPYMVSVVENLFRSLYEDYYVEIDGKRYDGKYTIIVAANGKCYGGGFWPVPEADPSDGELDILLVRDVTQMTVMRVINAYKHGKYKELTEYITHVRGKSMSIRQKQGKAMTVNLDGEIAVTQHLNLRLAAGKLSFAVPEKAM